MSKTVSFVARDELAEWLESRADEEMKSVSAVCQDIVAAEYRRERQEKADKGGGTGTDEGGSAAEEFDEPMVVEFSSKDAADAARTEFSSHIDPDLDDRRLTEVWFREGTPPEVVEELERRAEGFTPAADHSWS